MTPLLVHDAFFAAAARRPREVAVTHEAESRTFSEIAMAIPTFVRALAASGVGRGDRVATLCETDLDLVPLYFACAAIGATFTPANPGFTEAEARAVFDLAEPRLLVVDERHDGDVRLGDLAASAPTGGVDIEPVLEDDGHILFFTSGTTGTPKAIELSHRTDMLRVLSVYTEFPAGPTASMFPLFHMSGWMSATAPWLRGEEVVLCDASDVDGLLRAMEIRRAERFYAIPAVWHRILDAGVEEFDLSALRCADTGTSATSSDLLDAIHDALPHTTTDVTYGSTEAGGVCKLAFKDIHRKPGSVGQPGPSVVVRVDETGELWTTSPFLFTGYFRNPQATAEALVDGWYRTGELAAIDEDGYVTIVGRATEMIRSGGESVAPAEIDLVLMQHPAIADAAVAGLPDPEWGETIAAFVVVHPGRRIDLEDLQHHCEAHLARFKVPRRLVLVDEIPRTGATRQVQRQVLVERA